LIFDNELSVTTTHNNIIGKIDTNTITEEEAILTIDNILSRKTIEFLKNNTKPLKVFLTGGVDSLLVYSYIQKYTNNYELILSEHFDYDYFTLKNSYTLKKNYWGYNQIHYWSDDCVLSSGAPGDEFMLRSPTTANIFCRHYDQSIPKLLKDNRFMDCLHFNYFLLEKHDKIFKQQKAENKKFNNLEELIKFLCNMNANDFQHWHIGKTLTWTPLRDLEIFKTLLRLDFDTAVGQIMDSSISKKLIARNNPDLIKLISDSKNYENCMSNLVYLLN
jgi:asparagine synthetase B (glutamine-hydrolysing)